jgi:hypothetical protein
MFDDFVRDLHLLQKADSVIGKIWLDVLARRVGFYAFAGLIAVFGLAMLNVAGFYGLQEPVGPVWASVIVALADFVLAAILMLVGKKSAPGSEIEQAIDIRKMALESVQADARDLKSNVDAFRQEVRDAKDSVVAFVHNPLDSAVQNLLVPAAISIISGLHAKKDQA